MVNRSYKMSFDDEDDFLEDFSNELELIKFSAEVQDAIEQVCLFLNIFENGFKIFYSSI